jgi:hypothetical protein
MGTTPPSAHATPRDVIVPPPPAAAPPGEAPAGQAPDQPARGTPW